MLILYEEAYRIDDMSFILCMRQFPISWKSILPLFPVFASKDGFGCGTAGES